MDSVRKAKTLWRISLIFVMIGVLVLTGTVYGQDSGGDPPTDPGSGGGQDATKTYSTQWVVPHGTVFYIGEQEYDIVLDWENFDVSSARIPGESDVVFLGITGYIPVTGTPYDGTTCGNGNGLGNCHNDNGNGNNNGGGPMPSEDCGGAWITPGKITATAQQIAPANALVIGQDPAENGVTLDWHVAIQPTVISYFKWQLVGHRMVACIEDTAGEPYPLPEGMKEDCPHGWHSLIEHIYACTSKNKIYQEGIADLSADASLQLASRAWILGELATAYPGAHLKNPDWGFGSTPACVWVNDVCIWDFTLTIPVTDPGWYDLKVSGMTTGTKASPPRSFEVQAGEFGAYMIDTSEE